MSSLAKNTENKKAKKLIKNPIKKIKGKMISYVMIKQKKYTTKK